MGRHISPELRKIVHQAVAILGEVVRSELGDSMFGRIERIRSGMARLRQAPDAKKIADLRRTYRDLERLDSAGQREIARAFTLMLELMNACENAYRSHRIRKRRLALPETRPDSLIYVLTAHPTEARSPQNTWAFHQIQDILTEIFNEHLEELDPAREVLLRHWIEIAWKAPAVRSRKPRVEDEAEQIYGTLLREDTLTAFLRAGRELAPVYARSWVGGDKDGHPGVDEKSFLHSLALSRCRIGRFILKRLGDIDQAGKAVGSRKIETSCRRCREGLKRMVRVTRGDVRRVLLLRVAIRKLIADYSSEVKAPHPAMSDLQQVLGVFPAFVVPLEFRESSDLLMADPKGKRLAIFRMLKALAGLSAGGDPRWYVRGMIVSMAGKIEHLQVAADLVRRALGGILLPVIPLFEQRAALQHSSETVEAMLKDRGIRTALRRFWGGYLEIMLGYSDSSKEVGVLPSRLEIAEAMHAVDRLCRKRGVTPLFFQGSGGSVDRGGGTVEEQTAWWSSGALRNYKVTLQGEMIERSLASPEITRGQLERIVQSAGLWKKSAKRRLTTPPAVGRFAMQVADHYGRKVQNPEFIRLIERATPFLALDTLKIGSRPTKRGGAFISVGRLRAIPWVLCWTQTRVLFPTWWGIGSAWKEASSRERKALIREYGHDPVFSTYARALGFTLAKVELPVFRIYLEKSGLPAALIERYWREFTAEFSSASSFARAVLGGKLLGWRPWLEESIMLRSPMIHPLNLLQIIALRKKDPELLRLTVLGTASGMMNTG